MHFIDTALQRIKRAWRSRRNRAGLIRELAGLDIARLDDLGLRQSEAEILLSRGPDPRPGAGLR
ncbi:hypothetical protein AAU61_04320 [Desulfocarbo indianensis]|nr:hypothetical protein AAU61_04320 [Desulfocarbo indianensis]